MRCSITNARKLHCSVVYVCTCHFHAVPAQAWWARPCSPLCRDPRHDMALMFLLRQHGTKYFVSRCASDHAKRPCHNPPSNGMVQVPALPPPIPESSQMRLSSPYWHDLCCGWGRNWCFEMCVPHGPDPCKPSLCPALTQILTNLSWIPLLVGGGGRGPRSSRLQSAEAVRVETGAVLQS
jgi:hypothetical protein